MKVDFQFKVYMRCSISHFDITALISVLSKLKKEVKEKQIVSSSNFPKLLKLIGAFKI